MRGLVCVGLVAVALLGAGCGASGSERRVLAATSPTALGDGVAGPVADGVADAGGAGDGVADAGGVAGAETAGDGIGEGQVDAGVQVATRPARVVPPCPDGGCGGDEAPWLETREGFIHRFAYADVRDAKLKKERDPARLVAALSAQRAMKVAVFGAPVVELAPEGKLERKAAAPVYALAARVYSPAREAVLRVSFNGDAVIALNGVVVHAEKGDQYLLPDHRTVPVSLKEGWNDLALRLEKVSPYAVSLTMRLRAADGSALDGVAWDVPREALSGTPAASSADPCAPFEASVSAAIVPEGWRLDGRLVARGLVPHPAPRSVTLRRNGSALAEVGLDASAPETVLSGVLPADLDGEISLMVDGVVCARRQHAARPAERRRYLEAAERVEGLAGTTLGPGGRESLAYQAEDVRGLLEREGPVKRLEATLAHLEARIADARADLRPFHRPGLHVRAYRSEYDGSLQRYLVLVPKSYSEKPRNKDDEGHPLILLAHGLEYTPEDMMRIAFGKPAGPGEAYRSGAIYKWDPPEPPNGAIIVAHDGYGNAGQRAPGEVDVRRVIDEVKAAYRVDPRRVSISGFSLGGSVAFWVPFHAPSVFSASAPLCGYPNIHEYRSVKIATKRPWEPRLLEEEGVVAYAESGKYLPLWMVHGAQDNPARSELIHERYKTLRYQSDLDVPPLGHNVWDKTFEEDKLLKWLSARRRPKVAPQPVLRTGRYRFGESYWLRVDRFEDEGVFGVLSGQLKGRRVEVTTRGVRAFSLLGRELGERREEPQAIVVDGRNLGEHVVGEALRIGRVDGAWRVLEAAMEGRGSKRAGVEGPLGDVWFGPAIVVYGTQVVSEIEANRLTAERVRMHSPWIDLRLPMKADTEVRPEDLVGRSIILVGRPASNLVTRKAEAALAAAGIGFEEGAIVFGDRRFVGPEVGISVIRPSPFDPDRYLVVHAGVGPEGTLSARYLPEFAPDFLIYDSRVRAVFGDRILGPREVLHGGFFDAEWGLPEGGTAQGGR